MCKKVYLWTAGCQMNVRDSEVISGLLRTMNYELTNKPDEADVIIFNTCSVRQHAEDKVWSEIGRHKNKKLIGIVGCMATNYKEKIFERAPNVNFVVGPQDIHKIPEIIKKLTRNPGILETKIWETDSSVRPDEIYHTGFYEDKEHAYVVISEGCSNFCSYCVVPYVRGELRNRDYENILREIKEAVGEGITKITLLGQNVCAYGAENREQSIENRENISLLKLLELVNQIKALKEFSFITSHPKDTSVELFKAMAELGKLKKYLHLPVQSGANRILKLMNRGYTKEFYLDLVDEYRKIVKDASLTTDIIVGFPGETEEDFQQTVDLVKKVEFDAAYIFKYSIRPNTEAAKLDDGVAGEEKQKRHRLILELQKKISKNSKFKYQSSK